MYEKYGKDGRGMGVNMRKNKKLLDMGKEMCFSFYKNQIKTSYQIKTTKMKKNKAERENMFSYS